MKPLSAQMSLGLLITQINLAVAPTAKFLSLKYQ